MTTENQAPSNLPAVPQRPAMLANWRRMHLSDWDGPKVLHNLDGEPRAKARLLSKACGPKDLGADDLGSDPFPVRWWLVESIELANQDTGEVGSVLRTVLIAPDGRTLGFCSDGIAKSLETLVQVLGPGPYDPPLSIRVRKSPGRGGGKVYTLELLDDEPAKPAEVKRGK